jgi:transcriptional regulator with XRE-family HTH domain
VPAPTPKSLAATIARQLRAARRIRGLTQAEVAEQVGIAVEVYGRLERARALPRADTLVRLVASLGVSADALLGLAPGPSPSHQHAVALAAEPTAPYAPRPEMRRLLRRLEHEPARAVRLLAAFVSALQEGSGKPRGES